MANFGYAIYREGDDTILAVDTRRVSKERGLILIAATCLIGLFFLGIALTSSHHRALGTTIFLASVVCAAVTLRASRTIMVRNIIFTPEALVVDSDGGRRSFELALVEGFISSRYALKMRHGSESVTLLRRLLDAHGVCARASQVLREYATKGGQFPVA
jgi:hypothetical protein